MALWDSGGGARPGARSCTAGHPRLVQPGPRLRPARGTGPTAAHAGRACHRPCWGRAGRVPHAARGLRSLPTASAQWGECAFLGRPAEPTTASNCPQARGASFSLQAGSPPLPAPPLPAPHGTRVSAVPRGVAPACTRGSRHTCSGTEVCRGQQGPVPPRRLLSPSRSLPPPRPPARPAPSRACASWASARAPPAPAPHSAGPPQATVPTRCPSRLPSLSSQHVSLRW